MAKNKQVAVLRSSEESDSDSTSSSTKEEGSRLTFSVRPAFKNLTAKQIRLGLAAKKVMVSGSDSSDSDSDSDSTLKSIANKSTDDGSKLKRPRSRPNSKPQSTVPLKTPTKRPAVAGAGKDSKKPKTEKGGDEEVKKSVLFQRLWSDDDEVAILKGMLDYTEKKGVDPMVDANGFHDSVKESLHVDVDRKQLMDKVRRMKKRYKNSIGKRKTLNPHEQIVIELSKKIWEHEIESPDLDLLNTSSMKTRTISKAAAATEGGGKAEMTSPAGNKSSVNLGGKKEAENSVEGEKLGNRNSDLFIGRASVSMGLEESIVTVGLGLCGEDIKAEIEEKWTKLHLEESDLFLRKLELARQESEMIIAALRSKGQVKVHAKV